MKEKYIDFATGKSLEQKPEDMTSIGKNMLVAKNHPRIILRGQLDLIRAELILFMAECKQQNNLKLLSDLEEILSWIKSLQRSEVTGEPVAKDEFLGLSLSEVQQHSHDPQKYYGVPHLFGLDYNADIRVLKLNILKSRVRQTELAAITAAQEPSAAVNKDVIKSLNRLSSAIYLLELRTIKGEYDE